MGIDYGVSFVPPNSHPSVMTCVAAVPECLVCLSPHLDLGQSSGCWSRDELAVRGGLSLAPEVLLVSHLCAG